MAGDRQPASDERRREREERARRVVAAALSDEEFMRGVREGLESERLGEGTAFKDLKRKRNAGR